MTQYIKSTSFASKDSLPQGNPLKIVKGTEIDTEFNNIAVAVGTKADLLNPVFTGTPTAPTAAAGTSNTQLATTAFVLANGPAGSIPAGSVMLFVQTAAPTGWTKSSTHNNKALRVVSGTAGSGGSAAFTTAFGAPSVTGSVGGTVGDTTLTISQIPSHSHAAGSTLTSVSNQNPCANAFGNFRIDNAAGNATSVTGGGGSHSHSFSGSLSSATAAINVQYVDVIMATKD
jgi:hypothetical protein